MRKPLQPKVLFHDKKMRVSVTPSWVKFDKTSHTVSSITRLKYHKTGMSRVSKYALFFVSLTLVCLSGMHIVNESLPLWLARALLIASLVLFGFALWLTFRRPFFRIRLVFADGSHDTSSWRVESKAIELHAAITRAMDWHRSNNGGGDSDIINSVIARRHTAKSWSRTS